MEVQHLKALNFEFGFTSMSRHSDSYTQGHGCNKRKTQKCRNCLMDGSDAESNQSVVIDGNNIHEVTPYWLFWHQIFALVNMWIL